MRVPFYPAHGCCRICGRMIESGDGEVLCGECRSGARPHFDRAGSVFRFDGMARRMLLDYKFNGHVWMRDDFVDWLAALLSVRFRPADVELVLPMPLTLRHRFDRGFNQCDYLAGELARRIGRDCDTSTLRRVGSPRRQAGLSREERLLNVAGTFAVARPDAVAGRTVLVLDDVMTTGATLSECAKALKDAGAARVWAITLARPAIDA